MTVKEEKGAVHGDNNALRIYLHQAGTDFYKHETILISERNSAFIIGQSIMAAAFFLLFTNPKSNPWLFLALLNIAGSLFCLLYHAAGMIGARAALRWRDYILAIEDDKSPLDYPLHWFYDPSKLEQKKQTHKCFLKPLGFESNILPLQIAWIVTPFIFECGWVAASGYLVWRGNLLAFAIPSLVVSGAILLFIICRTLNLLMTGKISMRL